MPLITAAQIARVASKAAPHVVNAIVDRADDVLPRHGLVTPLRLQHFLAQMMVESGYLRTLEEDLSYSAARLMKVWPSRFRTLAAAEPYAHRPRELADLVYGGRMGNRPGTDDGWQGRGLGLLQNTGRTGRERLAEALHATPDEVTAMLADDGWMLECAAADFVALGCLPHADRDDVEGVTRCVNGGLTDIDGRRAALKLCARVWTPTAVVASAPARKPEPAIRSDTVTEPKSVQQQALDVLARIAADPNAAAKEQQLMDGLTAIVSRIPNSGPLSGYKTYIIGAVGALSTVAGLGLVYVQNGGLTQGGAFGALAAVVVSLASMSIRSAISGNHEATTDNIAAMGQHIAMQIAAPAVAGPAEAIGAVEAAVGALLPR